MRIDRDLIAKWNYHFVWWGARLTVTDGSTHDNEKGRGDKIWFIDLGPTRGGSDRDLLSDARDEDDSDESPPRPVRPPYVSNSPGSM